jgi:P-type Cu+ transporter
MDHSSGHDHLARFAGHDHAKASGPGTDPVCGMTVDPRTARHAEYQGATYYFCSEACRSKFLTDPKRYLAPAPKAASDDQIYTCPMHPQIRQVGPGFCPICGMALEPGPIRSCAT